MDSLVKETGLDWFKRLSAPTVVYQTGCRELDRLLGGGFKLGQVYSIDGEGATGKTQLCFTIIANHLLNQKNGTSYIYYIDFNSGFKPSRMAEILRSRDPSLNNEMMHKLLKRVLLVVVTSASDFHYFFTHFSLISKTHQGSLIICENVGLILAETTHAGVYTGQTRRDEIQYAMKHLAEKKCMPIILTNHMRKYKERQVPALFYRWNQAIPIHILMMKQNNERKLQLMDSDMASLLNSI
uniref:RECA_2 domain-containing protein n=1 Tax=Panagrellus redivivus TaxID=6233 RepID=A0A7E4W219_PANRE